MTTEVFQLESYYTATGNQIIPSATVTLKYNGSIFVESASGNGPIDAIFKCIDKIVGIKMHLISFEIRAVGTGSESEGEAIVKIQSNGYILTGQAASTNIIEAGTKAYLNAVNLAISSRKNRMELLA